MRRAVSAILLATLSVLAATELLCRFLPVSTATETEYRIDPRVRTYPPHHRWTTSTGWDLRRPQAMSANNEGFAAEHDFVRNPQAIALIGDSFVEASMLPMAQRLAHRLEATLGSGRQVYAMGNPGTSLLDYAERIRLAHLRYGVRDMVLFVEAGDVLQSVCGSGNIDGVCLDQVTHHVVTATVPPASPAKRLLRKSAFAQYLVSQLRLEPARLVQDAFTSLHIGHTLSVAGAATTRPAAARLVEVDRVLAAFLSRIEGHVAGKLVLLVDGRRGNDRQSRTWNIEERARFIATMQQSGAVVVDLEPHYAAHWKTSSLRLDVSPADAHLNSVGLELVAQAAVAALR